MREVVDNTTSVSTMFLSSRILPGHGYSRNRLWAAASTPLTDLWWRLLDKAIKCCTRMGISSFRLRNGGMWRLICATGAAEPVVLRPWLERASRGRSAPLVVVDLGVPRNVETLLAPPEGLQLIDITDLARRMEQDRERQASAVAEAESIVEQELRGWL